MSMSFHFEFKRITKSVIAAGLMAAPLLAPVGAQATPISEPLTFTVNTAFNGTSIDGSSSWLTASFLNAGANTVTLTLTSHLANASEFISEVAFNFYNAAISSPKKLTITETSYAGSALASISKDKYDDQELNGGGKSGKGFDIALEFATNNKAADRFAGSDVAVFTITGSGITQGDFNLVNKGNAAAYFAAHIQGLSTRNGGDGENGGDGSAVIKDGTPIVSAANLIAPNPPAAVPEPGTLLLWLAGLPAIGLWRNRATKKLGSANKI